MRKPPISTQQAQICQWRPQVECLTVEQLTLLSTLGELELCQETIEAADVAIQ